MKLTIVNHSGQAIPKKFLKSWVRRIERSVAQRISGKSARRFKQVRAGELVVVFLREKAARELNKRFRGKNYATDVLSFEGEGDLFGELIISPRVISRQAREHGLLVREELGYMVLHGILHLLGYDHEKSQAEAKRMFALQDEIFEELLRR